MTQEATARQPRHTPGPWRSDGCEIIGNSRIVATVTWCSGFEAEDASNRALIAAAPDMLAALKSCVAAFELHAEPPGFTETEWLAVEQARATIEQATSGHGPQVTERRQ